MHVSTPTNIQRISVVSEFSVLRTELRRNSGLLHTSLISWYGRSHAKRNSYAVRKPRTHVKSAVPTHTYLPDLLVCGDTTNQPGPEPIRDVVGEPESPERGLVVGVKVRAEAEGQVIENISGLWVVGTVRHEGGHNHVVVVDLQSNLKLLQELDVLLLQTIGDVLVSEELAYFTNA